ncbi:uncharacterized protein EDB91DRAFT_1083121 [Suillus paluster]|uniref:uncharacterized protein n=1 Tax=Suillus paluster TaxID=48578 RepID=UPI001B8606B3|nr:uncharacterized protein EDB91DRAFT_1083121 [Suillus paluster]KAG1737082.1 hypothetical protein EDB91DRAFT_1083121 [Suillus paluster]
MGEGAGLTCFSKLFYTPSCGRSTSTYFHRAPYEAMIPILRRLGSPTKAKHFLSNALKIATPQQTGDSARRRPFKLVRSPKQPNVQYYGYAVATKWLVQFAEQHWPDALLARNDMCYEDVATTRAYEYISAWSGIHDLGQKDCFNPKGGSVPPEWIALYDDVYDDVLDDTELAAIQIDTIQVFSVCSDHDKVDRAPASGGIEHEWSPWEVLE